MNLEKLMNTTERITLNFPIDHDGLPIAEVALRRPTVGDHLAAQKSAGSDAEREIRLIANLAELPPAAIHKLDMKDYAQLQKVLGGFCRKSGRAHGAGRRARPLYPLASI